MSDFADYRSNRIVLDLSRVYRANQIKRKDALVILIPKRVADHNRLPSKFRRVILVKDEVES
jgi:hypothetical protein